MNSLTNLTESGETVARRTAVSVRILIFSADFPERVLSSNCGSALALITPYTICMELWFINHKTYMANLLLAKFFSKGSL